MKFSLFIYFLMVFIAFSAAIYFETRILFYIGLIGLGLGLYILFKNDDNDNNSYFTPI